MKLELSHDILAKKVYERVSAEDKNLRKMERFIGDRYAFYQGEGKKLTAEEISYISPYFSKVDISPEERKFVQKGIEHKRLRRLLLALVVGAVIVGLIALSSLFYKNWRDAEFLRAQAESLRMQADSSRLIAETQTKKATQSLAEANRQRDRADSSLLVAEEQRLLALNNAQIARQKEAQAVASAARADSARKDAELARQAALAAQQNETIERLKADSLRIEAERKALVANLLTAQSLASQSLAIEDDERLKILLAREAHCIHEKYGGNEFDSNIYNALYQAEKAVSKQKDEISSSHSGFGAVRALRFSPDGSRLYSLGSDGKLKDFIIQHTGQEEPQEGIQNPFGRGLAMDISPSGQWIAAGGEGPFLSLIPTLDLNPNSAISISLREHLPETSQDTLSALAFFDDQHLWVSLLHTRKLIAFDLNTQKQTVLLDRLPGGLRKISLSPDRSYLAGLDEQGQLHLWTIGPAGLEEVSDQFNPGSNDYFSLCFGPGSKQIALGTKEGIINLFDLGNRSLIKLRGHIRTVSALVFSADGHQLASGSWDGTVRVWHLDQDYLQDGPLILAQNYPFSSGDPWCFSLAFAPDGRTLSAGYANGSIKYWPTYPQYWSEKLKQQETGVPLNETEWRGYIGVEIPYPGAGSICP